MIYTLQPGQSFDAEILRQELVAALGPDDWHINTAGNTVEFFGDGDPSAVILAHFDNGATRIKSPINVVTMRQARLALLQTGMLASVNSAVAAADEATKITWEFSSEVQRNNALVATLAGALNLTDAQLDDLFRLAATL